MNRMDQMNSIASVQDVQAVVVETLGLTGESAELTADTPLLGGLSEFDSLAVMELLTALERRFGITVEDEDVTASVFATVGSLAEFVDAKLR